MDIDVVLDNIRYLVDKYEQNNQRLTIEHTDSLVENINALDMWLSKQGYPPKAWERQDPLGRLLAKELLQTHKETGISLDKWRTARLFVERELFIEITPNNV